MRILVCGGRAFFDRIAIYRALDTCHQRNGISFIIAGAATGADTLAVEWAKERRIPFKEYPADWDTHRKAAWPIRNRKMLQEGKPDGVIAFPGNRGTTNMINQSIKAGLKVWQPKVNL